jgi:signal transduction histidine kinase
MATVQLAIPASDPIAGARASRTPARILYALWGVFWVLMVVIALQDYQRGGGREWWQPVLWELSSAIFATFWLLLERRIHARRYFVYLDRPWLWFAHHLKWLPLIAITFVSGVYALRHGVYVLVGKTYEHEGWLYVFVYETIKLGLFFGLWLGILFGLNSFAQWQSHRERLLAAQKSLAQAQLGELKGQLRPHFFFNALNTISALMHVDISRADRLLARLAELLRASLRSGDQDMTTLAEELRLLELYAQVMQDRFEDNVEIVWRVAEESIGCMVPTFLLQPLLENAFKHGVERSTERVRIEIEARRDGERLRIAVRNTGSRLPKQYREGVGVANCRERLRVLYANEATLELRDIGTGVEASVTLPWREQRA